MPRSPDDLAGSIPYLRRYARALTGSQALGDQYVGITLELVGGSMDRLGNAGDNRRELFRLFHQVWSSRLLKNPRQE
jgi:DNA-directed RNA polymerase specialized sigma24 family protein